MDMSALFTLMNAQKAFAANHPKVMAFIQTFSRRPLTEGTVIEIAVTRPNEEPVTASMKVKAEDLALLEQMKNLKMNG